MTDDEARLEVLMGQVRDMTARIRVIRAANEIVFIEWCRMAPEGKGGHHA